MRHVLPEDRDGVNRPFRAAAEGGTEWHFECRTRDADGRERRTEARGRPVHDAGGRPIRLLGVVADLTERKRAEERRALLLGELNHRVRTHSPWRGRSRSEPPATRRTCLLSRPGSRRGRSRWPVPTPC